MERRSYAYMDIQSRIEWRREWMKVRDEMRKARMKVRDRAPAHSQDPS